MTRFLSLVLGTNQPMFGKSISELEHAAGTPSEDIRLSSEIEQRTKQKISQLGLDPKDTTGPELYNALKQRLRGDEQVLRQALNIASDADADTVLSKIQTYFDNELMSSTCFALKHATAKRILKAKPPKNTMKALGYRSLDSMLKQEPAPAVYAVTELVESATWHKQFREQYAKLTPLDFEQRKITVIYPKSKRWQEIAARYVPKARQNIFCEQELGTVVILPLSQNLEGLTTITLTLTIQYLNNVRAYSSYTKLQQVKPNFGKIIQQTAQTEPNTGAFLASQPVPWKVIQKHYGQGRANYPTVFELHVQPDDLTWQDIGETLKSLHADLSFWQDSQYAAALHDNQPVSFNILDVAIANCNSLPYEQRISHFVREQLWHELMSRYLHQANLEAAIHQQLLASLEEPIE